MGRTRAKEKTGYLWVEEGERREGVVADVAPILPTSRTYSFAVPHTIEGSLALGQRVTVSLGRRGRLVQGFVVGLDRRTWDSTLRPIDSVVDEVSFLSPELIELGREISLHYGCPLGQTLKAVTPEAVRRQRGLKTVRYARLACPLDRIRESADRITPQRQVLLDALAAAPDLVPVEGLLDATGASATILRALATRGWVEIVKRKEVAAPAEEDWPLVEPEFELNEEQRCALERINHQIDENRFCVTLLFGVSGSGKTEVYIQAIRRVVETGKQAILLVPEIVLTTQLVQRLAARFENVAVSHSGLTDAQRSVIWRRVASGEKKVVIGTRSAAFAPCPNLGLICVDEEQETSYKNLQAPRFNVRDVAILRAKPLKIPVVLGSATPSIETWYNSAHRNHYERLVIRRRVRSLPMPKVHIVDMRDEAAEQKRSPVLSRLMERLLADSLGRKEQALILMNRRGFARRVHCPVCKTRVTCPHCNVSLVVHSATGQAVCHYCRTRVPIPSVCPNVSCGQPLVQTGLGTQRVKEVLEDRFPDARIARVDRDTMTHRRHYQQIITDFEARKIDMLVGTQMIAKGLDFPFVSFVGVIDADPGGFGSDFRAHERLFQLITQVAGRAGRADRAGQVVVQTTMPDIPALTCSLRHDYEAFVAGELEVRQKVGLPPFRRVARVVLGHKREATARDEADALADRIRAAIDSLSLQFADVLGPNPCVLTRIRGKYRYDLLIRTHGASDLRRLLHTLEEANALRTKAESTILDVDPLSLT